PALHRWSFAMGFYASHLGPRLVRCVCAMEDVRREREEIVPRASGTVLEIGIGPGLNLPFYDTSRVERVIGVDPNESFLRLGQAERGRCPVPLDIIVAPAEALPLADDSVDTAVVTFTLCSVDDPLQALAEVRRALRPEGRVLFLEHGLSDDPDVARWQHRLNPLWRPFAVGCNLTRPVRELFIKAGFRIDEVETYYAPRTPTPIGFQCRGIARAA
ncbi:MAG: class I SAM-dependent methyltransferase, partial [Pseudomonadota bacterium]|nr:class I SAM-dependent methyltransferase [Pseudomonadota bacterium]